MAAIICDTCRKQIPEDIEYDEDNTLCEACSIQYSKDNNCSGPFVEKFECNGCGTYYWVEDRSNFDCPNCAVSSNKKTPQETKDRAIQCIEQAIMVINNDDFDYLAGNLFIWDEGIHLHMAPDIPFDESFDEFICDATEEQKASLKPKLIEWLIDCLELAKNSSIRG